MKFIFLGFHVVVLVLESVDVSITNVELILTKLRWFQLVSTSQNSILNFFEKKFKFLGFHAVVLMKTFPLMYQLLMYNWYWRSQGDFFYRGADRWTDEQTDTVLESSYGNLSAHKKFQLKISG